MPATVWNIVTGKNLKITMETSENSNQFKPGQFPFTSWNIDEMLADVIHQSAKQFIPDHWIEAEKVSAWLCGDYEYFKNKALISLTSELMTEIQEVRTDHAKSFMESKSCQNWFGDETQADDLFFWYALILFYDLLLQKGFIVEEHSPAAEYVDRLEKANIPLQVSKDISSVTSEKLDKTGVQSRSKKPTKTVYCSFIDLLTNDFTGENLNDLLVFMLIKTEAGETLDFKKYKLHSIITGLKSTGFLKDSTQEGGLKSLLSYLKLPITRVKQGYGKDESKANHQVREYLIKLKKEREKNGSF